MGSQTGRFGLLNLGDLDDGGPPGPSLVFGTSTASTVFLSPLSQAASQAAQEVGVTNESKVGLLKVGDPTEYCGGVVGLGRSQGNGARRWCTKPSAKSRSGGCTIKQHRSDIVQLEANSFYIRGRVGQARLTPRLSASSASIPSEDIGGLST